MSNLIISFYPGAGGHRLQNKLLNLEFDKPGAIYDVVGVDTPLRKYRYLDNLSTVNTPNDLIILTHCMDVNLIKNIFPNRRIIQIVSDYKKSLRRQWTLMSRDFQKENFSNVLDNAFVFIKWHNQYYKNYPIAGQADEIINVNSDLDEFSVIMRNELNLESDIFDLAWDTYHQYGDDAPTITLYEEYINNAQK